MRTQIMTAALVAATAVGFAGVLAVSPVAAPAHAATCATDPFAISGHGGLSEDPTAGTVETGDRFGATLGSYHVLNPGGGDGREWSGLLLIGAPGYRSGAGEVIVTETGYEGDELTGAEAWQQITSGPEAGDGFGSWVDALQARD